MPSIVLGTDREAIQKDNNVCSYEAYISVQQINNTINILSKVTGTMEKTNRVREMGFWGRNKVWNYKQDLQCTHWCERWRKQGGKKGKHVNTRRKEFQKKGIISAKSLRKIAPVVFEKKQGKGQYGWNGLTERKRSRRRTQRCIEGQILSDLVTHYKPFDSNLNEVWRHWVLRGRVT